MLKRWAAWSQSTRWLVGGIAAVVVALAIGWVLLVPAADWLASHDVGHVAGALRTSRIQTARDAARGRLLTLGAGLFAAGALIFTALNFNLLRRNSEQADQWQRRTHELTEQGQVTDRYTKAIEQLGSEKLDVRIGGTYALERVARDSEKDHPTVMEVLAAFIREHSHEQWPKSQSHDARTPDRQTRPDVQAALTVIGRRDVKRDKQPIDLSGADLTRADLTGVDLTDAHLTSARLVHADLTKAKLTGAHLNGAHLNGADLSGADFTGAHLNGANLTALTGANFSGAHLTGAIWSETAPPPKGYDLDRRGNRLKRDEVDDESSGN